MTRFGQNKLILFGLIGADPEMRVTASGKELVKLSIATDNGNRKVGENQGQPIYEKVAPTWHRVNFWGADAITVHKNLKKGDQIGVECRMTSSKFTDKENIVRYTYEPTAYEIFHLGSTRRQDRDQGQYAGGGVQRPQQDQRRDAGPPDEDGPPHYDDDVPG
jgi:single-strand DNA-binding protein